MKWDDYFMTLAKTISLKSKDPSTKVGCVIVGPDNEIRSTGYNGYPRGMDDSIQYERPIKYKFYEHAERNAIYNSARFGASIKGCIIYISNLPPCTDCSRAIIQSGIERVYYSCSTVPERWREDIEISLQMLDTCGVEYFNLGD
jgi:dCMP deaminase